MSSERPSVALVLSALGLAFQAAGLLSEVFLFAFSVIGPGRSRIIGPFLFLWSLPLLALGVIIIAVGIAGLVMLNSGRRSSVAAGAILMIMLSALSFPTLFGFFIGSALMLIGGITAIIWVTLHPSSSQS